jgi:hypothetical protein
MKTLVDASVFGLVPIPSMTDTTERVEELWAADQPAALAIGQPIKKRMATREEIARIGEELRAIGPGAAEPAVALCGNCRCSV